MGKLYPLSRCRYGDEYVPISDTLEVIQCPRDTESSGLGGWWVHGGGIGGGAQRRNSRIRRKPIVEDLSPD